MKPLRVRQNLKKDETGLGNQLRMREKIQNMAEKILEPFAHHKHSHQYDYQRPHPCHLSMQYQSHSVLSGLKPWKNFKLCQKIMSTALNSIMYNIGPGYNIFNGRLVSIFSPI
jgi:hypothetical protein